MIPSSHELFAERFGSAQVHFFSTRSALGEAAAAHAAELIRAAIQKRGRARIMVGTGNSQDDLIDALVQRRDVDWARVEAFHMDEYIGISPDHPASFRRWLRTRVATKLPLADVHYMEGDAANIEGEIARYSRLLSSAPLDLAFVGFGENGHIAFNDPPVADFADPAVVKVVTLEVACRRQQVGEGHFKTIDSVPQQAITVTCAELLRAESWICAVPERRKAQAVRDALLGPISIVCPASVVRRHPVASVYLDAESASLLPRAAR
jgi:glucosamine-6-phosphate deaminase